MTRLNVSTSQPQEWIELSRESDALFGTRPWQMLLERSFGCRTIYVYNKATGFAISVFRAGPFKIGYLGFPVGGGIGVSPSLSSFIDALCIARLRGMPVCLRIPVSTFAQQADLDFPYQSNPETVIGNLQEWRPELISKKLRRDVRKSERSELIVSEAAEPRVGDKLYEMYSRTVKRRGGAIRYNAAYFRELIKLAKVQPRLRVLIAEDGTEIAGFVVIARHGNTAYYLHGGANPMYQRFSPSDLLLNSAIHRAQQEGSQHFNLMASPSSQPSLVRYKEKWGGITRELKTYTLPLRPSYRLFKTAEWVYRFIR